MTISTEQLNINRAKLGLPPLSTPAIGTQTTQTTQKPSSFGVDTKILEVMKQTGTKKTPTVEKKPGLLEEVGQRRGSEVVKSIQAQQRGEQGILGTIGQVGGQVLGGASDILFGTATRALSAITPDIIEKPIRQAGSKALSAIFSTQPGQAVAKGIQKFEQSNTPTTRNIKALLGAGEFALDATGLSAGAKVAEKTIAKTAEKVGAKVGEKLAERQVTKVPKIIVKAEELYAKATDVAPSAKKIYEERFNEPISKALAERRIPIQADGAKLKTEASIEKIDSELIPALERPQQQIYKTIPKQFNLEDTLTKYKQSLVNKPILEAEKKAQQKAAVEFLIQEMKKGVILVSEDYNNLKRAFNKFYDGADTAKNEAARDLQTIIRKDLVEAYQGNNIIQSLNNEYSKVLTLRNALAKMNDKVIKGGILGKRLTQVASGLATSKIPVIGPLVGYSLSGKIIDYLINPERLTAKAIAQLEKLKIIPPGMKVKEDVFNYLMENFAQDFKGTNLPKLLPEGKTKVPKVETIITPSGLNPNIYPSQTIIEAPAKKIGNQFINRLTNLNK